MADGKLVGILSDSPDTIRAMVKDEGSASINMITGKVTWLENLKEPFVEITMPCGEHQTFKMNELPKNSLKCPCGDPTHWLIEYKNAGKPPRLNISNN